MFSVLVEEGLFTGLFSVLAEDGLSVGFASVLVEDGLSVGFASVLVEDGLFTGLVSVLVEEGLFTGLFSVLVEEGLFTGLFSVLAEDGLSAGLLSVEFLISLINLFFKSLLWSALILSLLKNSLISSETLIIFSFTSELLLFNNLCKILVEIPDELSTRLIFLILFSFKKL